MENKPFYITTAIHYANARLHLGHAYETVAADAMARYKRMRGYDVKFLTGMDEHGQKTERSAAARRIPPQAHVDEIAELSKVLMKNLSIQYDIFWRTTNEQHRSTVKKIFNRLHEQGDIYKGSYEGLYCTPCETFYTKHQLDESKCPECQRDVEPLKEEAYFFKMSKYQDRLIKNIKENPGFIKPKFRENEMLNFIDSGLEDLCVSRTSFTWGVPVEFDPEHVVYVWVDALSNYISALGFLSENDSDYKKYWPADVHIVGKDIMRFHTIVWPALLMALDEPLPKLVFGHGHIVIDGKKMGKSFGNAVDPEELAKRYGPDAIRYFLLREVVFGQDGNFTFESLIKRINAELANDLGNLLSRTVGMIDKYFGGQLPTQQAPADFDDQLIKAASEAVQNAEELYDEMAFSDALTQIWNLVRRANKYIDEVEPWKLAKDEGRRDVLAGSLYNLAECLRIIAILITPVMPDTPKIIRAQLNIPEKCSTWNISKQFGILPKDVRITKGEVAFPRIDVQKELERFVL